ncbi:MAG: MotA/TolQ/ExbB proton channel family protein [Kordiimonadaceae bacterium]|jgi:biopolymer transport protein ExbB|nr:MotA/TolQ/ExbB proton channel family protein [Kordiimonadaceae bacterium]MBT6037214.1 MotA/TolQ/ExbB proton channel family protein [Kordiimonadaceae bacterium]MBT6328671.1 MotA/TolQ/ExbB proton channel family protein [Kordiimonadaceae bacterium]MBT7583420.1 MotA/TolQ/ExbB proton channel family protein [Kordiimonadaceae bacterium]
MLALVTAYELVRDFMERGGPVLLVIFIAILVLWAMVLERMIYFKTGHNRQVNEVMGTWEGRTERTSWYAHKIREGMISQINMDLRGNLSHIKTLVAVIPLMGLLGTVWGMIEVFDVLSVMGSANVKAMSAGISKATIPTMAGMVGALSGVFAASYIEARVNKEAELVEDHLTMDH